MYSNSYRIIVVPATAGAYEPNTGRTRGRYKFFDMLDIINPD